MDSIFGTCKKINKTLVYILKYLIYFENSIVVMLGTQSISNNCYQYLHSVIEFTKLNKETIFQRLFDVLKL